MTDGRKKIKITLNGSLIYYFDAWVGDQVGQDAILGINFMVPAGIRLDLADGNLCLPDEVRILLSGQKHHIGRRCKQSRWWINMLSYLPDNQQKRRSD